MSLSQHVIENEKLAASPQVNVNSKVNDYANSNILKVDATNNKQSPLHKLRKLKPKLENLEDKKIITAKIQANCTIDHFHENKITLSKNPRQVREEIRNMKLVSQTIENSTNGILQTKTLRKPKNDLFSKVDKFLACFDSNPKMNKRFRSPLSADKVSSTLNNNLRRDIKAFKFKDDRFMNRMLRNIKTPSPFLTRNQYSFAENTVGSTPFSRNRQSTKSNHFRQIFSADTNKDNIKARMSRYRNLKVNIARSNLPFTSDKLFSTVIKSPLNNQGGIISPVKLIQN